jgi:Rrf2 family nitric oxide-sensitive transcriptional repressor
MQLTRFADLGLRVLMYLSQHERPEPITIHEIAEQFQVPANHLAKVVQRLGQLGWVSTLRGRHGGLRLAVPPADIRIGTVIEQLEANEHLIDCEALACVLNGHCGLSRVLDAAQKAFFEHLNQHTLADVSRKKTAQAIVHMHRDYLSRHADH